MSTTTLLAQGLVSCHVCSEVAPLGTPRCATCDEPLHARKPASLSRTSALLLASALLYIPANLLPIMTYRELGIGEPKTILAGCRELMAEELWSLAAIVFVASIVVPMLKLVGLGGLVWSVRRRSQWRMRERAQLFRLVDFIGRWSMVDIFVIGILVSLVQLGALAEVEVGPAATFFAAVVVLTMLAAESFDPRLIWDCAAPTAPTTGEHE